MSYEATISRKKALDAAAKAVEKADELTARHNETIEEVAKIRRGLTALTEHTEKRLNAQLAMIETANQRLDRYVTRLSDAENRIDAVAAAESSDAKRLEALVLSIREELLADTRRRDAELARRQERFEQMGFWARLWWVLFGADAPFSH